MNTRRQGRHRRLGPWLLLAAWLLVAGNASGWAQEQAQVPTSTETLQIMGKGGDYVIVGEERPMYVVDKVTVISNRYGGRIDLTRLQTPCVAEITYAWRYQGVDKSPVALEIKVKRLGPRASVGATRDR